tara:strand:+ start:709 stop:1116 length:408 start_codon:yes stop_codon:yes gene_type:complete
MGAHGSINTWTDNSVRLTIRPEVRAFTVEDVAAIIASRYDLVPENDRWRPSDYEPQTYQETWSKILEEKITKKTIMRILTDCWYIANYEEGTDSSVRIDLSSKNKERESHQAVVDFIKMKFPKFMTTEEYNTVVH